MLAEADHCCGVQQLLPTCAGTVDVLVCTEVGVVVERVDVASGLAKVSSHEHLCRLIGSRVDGPMPPDTFSSRQFVGLQVDLGQYAEIAVGILDPVSGP